MRLLYTAIYATGFVLLSPVFLFKMWKRGKYRDNFLQRFGIYAAGLRQRLTVKAGRRCWIQAVSVGEINVALVLIRALQKKLPGLQVILTTTTSTGYALARERLSRNNGAVELLYFPQDFPWPVRRAYELIQPDFVVLIECELWPNHLWEGGARGIPLLLVNGRMSARSARSYRRLGWLFRRVFRQLLLACAQSPEDAENFAATGVPRSRVHVTGNLKYDASLPEADSHSFDPGPLLQGLGVGPRRPILVAGSTHPGEEELLFDLLHALRPGFPDLFLVVVPRHVERAREIVELAQRRQIKIVRRTEAAGPAATAGHPYDCLLVDTTGELKLFYQIATVIYVGKSLVGKGGQNIVEAAASGHPVLFGPHMENFQAIARQFVIEGAGIQVGDAKELREAVASLLQSPARRQSMAAATNRVIAANVGATDRTVDLLLQTLAEPAGRAVAGTESNR